MPTPSPITPTKGAGTTLWIYGGAGDPYEDPLADADWTRLAKIKELTPGELTADSYDDTYIDDDAPDWDSTAQGVKSAGETDATLAWKPGEDGQKSVVEWFMSGDEKTYKIKYPNGAVDVFTGWISSLGKTVARNDVITRSIKVTNKGKPSLAEKNSSTESTSGVSDS